MTAELVGPLPTVTFHGGPGRFRSGDRPRVAYDVTLNTMDPRFARCTDHHVACDCREALLAENLREFRLENRDLRTAAWRALAGHQVDYPLGLTDAERVIWNHLCLCSGCVIHRATYGYLLPRDVIDWMTGRVRPFDKHAEVRF